MMNFMMKHIVNSGSDKMNKLEKENFELRKRMKEVHEYFINYLLEIKEEIDYEVYSEMLDMIEKLE